MNYPSCLINILSKAYIIGRDKIDELMYPAVMVPLTGSPFLPWSEIMLRSSFILDLHMALEKLDSNGGLVLKFQFVTLCSRLFAQVMALLLRTFSSAEIHYIGIGTVMIWLKKIKPEIGPETISIINEICNCQTCSEVLECFPFHELVENRWIVSLLRNINDFMIESISRIVLDNK